VNDLGLEQADDGFSQGIVDTADRRFNARLGEAGSFLGECRDA